MPDTLTKEREDEFHRKLRRMRVGKAISHYAIATLRRVSDETGDVDLAELMALREIEAQGAPEGTPR